MKNRLFVPINSFLIVSLSLMFYNTNSLPNYSGTHSINRSIPAKNLQKTPMLKIHKFAKIENLKQKTEIKKTSTFLASINIDDILKKTLKAYSGFSNAKSQDYHIHRDYGKSFYMPGFGYKTHAYGNLYQRVLNQPYEYEAKVLGYDDNGWKNYIIDKVYGHGQPHFTLNDELDLQDDHHYSNYICYKHMYRKYKTDMNSPEITGILYSIKDSDHGYVLLRGYLNINYPGNNLENPFVISFGEKFQDDDHHKLSTTRNSVVFNHNDMVQHGKITLSYNGIEKEFLLSHFTEDQKIQWNKFNLLALYKVLMGFK